MNVKLVGHQVGLTAGPNGPTHMAIEDIAYTRAQPGLVVVEAADAVEMACMVNAIAEYEGPVYMRVGRDDRPILFGDDHQITLGKARQLRDGADLTIVASGIEVGFALDAAETLDAEGIRARVLNMHTLKPLDAEAVIRAANDTGAIVTAENHNIHGGLGSAVAEVLVENAPVPMRRVGLRDRFAESGPIPGLFEKYGLVARDIAQAARDVLAVKKR
jgi:transketolase